MISDENLHSLPKSLRLCVCEVFQYVTPDRNNSALTVVMKPNKISPSKTFNNSWLSGSKTKPRFNRSSKTHPKKKWPNSTCRFLQKLHPSQPPQPPSPPGKMPHPKGICSHPKIEAPRYEPASGGLDVFG